MNKTMRHNYVRPWSECIRVAAMHTLLAGSVGLEKSDKPGDPTSPILAPRNDWYEDEE